MHLVVYFNWLIVDVVVKGIGGGDSTEEQRHGPNDSYSDDNRCEIQKKCNKLPIILSKTFKPSEIKCDYMSFL